jgi:predicted transcriptional regulator
MGESINSKNMTELAVAIVSAYVSKNAVASTDLPSLIHTVHAALSGATPSQTKVPEAHPTPAVPVTKSVTRDYIVCLDDGKKFKSLKRHLGAAYGITPEQYRERWGLPADYPMVAPNYTKKRSELAKGMGLGQRPTEVEVFDERVASKGRRSKQGSMIAT